MYNANVVLLEKGIEKIFKKSVVPYREQQRKCTPKIKNTPKKCENTNAVPLEKGTAETKSVIPLENEQQKRKCRCFGKGIVKIKSVVPLEK